MMEHLNKELRLEAEKRILESIMAHYGNLLRLINFENLKVIIKDRRNARILQALSLTEVKDRSPNGLKAYNKLDIANTLRRICVNEHERVECEKVLINLDTNNYSHFRFETDIHALRKATWEEEKKQLKQIVDESEDSEGLAMIIEAAILKLKREIFPDDHDGHDLLLPCSAKSIIADALDKKELSNDGALLTGSNQLNRNLGGGVKPGQLTILAAQPGVGKTTFALNIVNRQISRSTPPCVAIFTLEMNSDEIVKNLLNMYHKRELKTDIFEDHFATADFNDLELYVFDKEYSSMDKITTAIRRLHTEKDLKLVVIDYLQLISPDNNIKEEQQSISHKLSNITRRLKELTLDLNISIICLSQLNRNFSNRVKYSKNKEEEKPELSDLRGSGAIEQDADVVLFLQEQEDHTLLTVAKNRRGKTGSIKFNFKKDYGIFEEIKKE